MIALIESTGANIRLVGRRNGGYAIEQGDRHILLSRDELGELVSVCADVLADAPGSRKRYRMA